MNTRRGNVFGVDTLKPWLLVLLCAGLAACSKNGSSQDQPMSVESAQPADTVYINGAIYTVNEQQPWVEAIAVKDGVITAAGSAAAVDGQRGAQTRVVDLEGKFMMPGLVDEHIHPDMGADNYLNVFLMATDSWSEVTQKIQAYREANPDKRWIYGGTLNWLADDSGAISGTDVPSNKKSLDMIVADRPMAFWDQGAHAMLLNSLALQELGIDDDTPDPAGGIIVRDESGEATGVLRETACTLVLNALDNFPNEVWTEKGMKPFLEEMASYGVTAVHDAYGTEKNVLAYGSLERQGGLNMYIGVSFATPLEFNDPERKAAADALIRRHKTYASDLVYPNGVKYILDGSAAGKTAGMLEPFIGTDERGELRYSEESIEAEMREYAALGLAFKAHAIGDRSVRVVLDIFDRLPDNTSTMSRSISHGTLIALEDIPRVAESGTIFEASPSLWFPNDGVDVMREDIGDRVERVWPIAPLVKAGATVSYGSDWTVSLSPDPWPGLEAIVTREQPGGSDSQLGAQFAVGVETALKIFTLNGAEAIGIGDRTGSLEVGKSADMIVLDRNPMERPARELHATRVLRTIFRGEEIYRAE